MDIARPSNPLKLLTLQETAQKLAVSVDTLLKWNEFHILQPTITQSGEIGYTTEQIEEFQAIQQALLAKHAAIPQQQKAPEKQKTPESMSSTSVYASSDTQQAADAASFSNTKLASPLLVSSFAVIFATLLIFALTQQGATASQDADNTQKQANTTSQTSKLDVSQQGKFGLSAQATNTKNGTSDSVGLFSGKVASVLYERPNVKQNTASSKKTQVPSAALAGLAKSVHSQTSTVSAKTPTEAEVAAAMDAAPLASVGKKQTTSSDAKSSLDENGNITGGDTLKNTNIATLVGGASAVAGNSYFEDSSNTLRNQFIVMMLGALGMGFWYIKKPKKAAVVSTSSSKPVTHPSQKVLEVDQKMDGTVILTFQGNMYKISKPELYSDSDRFIERLMELIQPGLKEIEYDSFTDEKLRLTAPLSRLVTRLGFVGIKRDLFFPRTSKNRVLFRKYVTYQDLTAMNLTPAEIAKDLLAAA